MPGIELKLSRSIGDCDTVLFSPLRAADAIELLDMRDDPVGMINAVARHGDLCGQQLADHVDDLAPADAADMIEIGMALLGLSADGEFQETPHGVEVRKDGGVYFPLLYPIKAGDDEVVALEFKPVSFGEIKDVYALPSLKEKFLGIIRASAVAITGKGDQEPITDQLVESMRAEDAVGITLHVLPVFFGSERRWKRL